MEQTHALVAVLARKVLQDVAAGALRLVSEREKSR
jgi:hypothetical protein